MSLTIDKHIEQHEALGIIDKVAVVGIIKDYIHDLDFQESVIDRLTTDSALSPSEGDRYLVIAPAADGFAGHADDIAEYTSAGAWEFITPDEATLVEVEDEDTFYYYNGSAWVLFPSVLDHGTLAGLTPDDDHTQYALLAGRSGGQDLVGGSDASDDLILESTSHATKGQITAKDRFETQGAIVRAAKVIDDTDSPYSLLTTDHVLFVDVSSGSVSIDLPSAQVAVNGREVKIKDSEGMASVYNITITTEGSETIDGSSSLVVVGDRSCVVLTSDGTNWQIV